MVHHLSFSHGHLSQTHSLSDAQLAAHPSQLGRILYFALPFAFAFILNVSLLFRNRRIHANYPIKTLPSDFANILVLLIATIGSATVGIYAVITDAWTVKEWILFTVVCVLLGLKPLIFTADTTPTLFISAIVTIFAALPNEWLFAELRDLAEKSQDEIGWKHVTRNVIGFIEAYLVIIAVAYLSQVLVHIFKASQKGATYFFWIVAPLAAIGLLVVNILLYGPFLDVIGYIVATLLLFLGAANSTLFHNVRDQESIPLKK